MKIVDDSVSVFFYHMNQPADGIIQFGILFTA